MYTISSPGACNLPGQILTDTCTNDYQCDEFRKRNISSSVPCLATTPDGAHLLVLPRSAPSLRCPLSFIGQISVKPQVSGQGFLPRVFPEPPLWSCGGLQRCGDAEYRAVSLRPNTQLLRMTARSSISTSGKMCIFNLKIIYIDFTYL